MVRSELISSGPLKHDSFEDPPDARGLVVHTKPSRNSNAWDVRLN